MSHAQGAAAQLIARIEHRQANVDRIAPESAASEATKTVAKRESGRGESVRGSGPKRACVAHFGGTLPFRCQTWNQ